jgi:hypothetical protein
MGSAGVVKVIGPGAVGEMDGVGSEVRQTVMGVRLPASFELSSFSSHATGGDEGVEV